MRFDDMLATVLARPSETAADRVAQWRQLLDLLAQRRFGSDGEAGEQALDRLAALRPDVPVAVRQETARAFAGRPLPAALVAFLAADVPAVAGILLRGAQLGDTEWLAILPRLSPTGRGFLRHRRDLGPHVEAALAGFGQADLLLTGGVPVAANDGLPAGDAGAERRPHPLFEDGPAPDADAGPEEPVPAAGPFEPGGGEGQIRAIISRIARYRREREGPHLPGLEPDDPAPAASFVFETGPDGVIRWVQGAPRGAIVGETIATSAAGRFGVDAEATGAFHRRTPFRDARLTVAGSGAASGEWRIAGVPVFAAGDGHFLGYRGTARRPNAAERAQDEGATDTVGFTGGGLPPDSIRQLVHELRTPLNAIGGFAEMMRRQMRGPISAAYRERAQAIVEHAGRLLAAVDDLDVAARLETERLDLQRTAVDFAPLVAAACNAHAEPARVRGVTLLPEIAPGLPSADADPSALRRMTSRLVAACAGLAGEGEAIRAALALSPDGRELLLSVTRPARLVGQDTRALLDPAYGPEGDWPDAPLLGLGFSLHLLRRLAAAAGGALDIGEQAFRLRVPASRPADPAGTGS